MFYQAEISTGKTLNLTNILQAERKTLSQKYSMHI